MLTRTSAIVVLRDERRQVVERAEDRDALEPEPALGEVVVDEADRRDGVGAVLEQLAHAAARRRGRRRRSGRGARRRAAVAGSRPST